MSKVVGPYWLQPPKENKLKKYCWGVFWRITAAISIITVGSCALTFVNLWGPNNWLINTIYEPKSYWLYAICGACFVWPLAVRLKEVLVLQPKTNKLIKIPAGLVRGSASLTNIALPKFPVKRRG